MIVEDNVDLLVGTFSSEVTQRITGTIADEDVPFIITGSADQSTMANTTGDDYEHNKNIFRTGPINSELQAEAMADYAEFLSDEHGWNTFGHLSEEAAWTKSFQELLPDELRSRGFDVPYDDTVSLSTDNYTSILDDQRVKEWTQSSVSSRPVDRGSYSSRGSRTGTPSQWKARTSRR